MMKNINYLMALIVLTLCFSSPNYAQNYTLNFDGVDDYVELGTSVANSVESIELWFKPATTINNSLVETQALLYRHNVMANNQDFGIYIGKSDWGNRAGRIVFHRNIGSASDIIVSDSDTWNAGEWYHVVAIANATGMKMYINGVLQQNESAFSSGPIRTDNSVTVLGRWGYLDIRHFEGELDNIRMWRRTLNQAEIRSERCHTLVPSEETNLRAYWNIDQQAGDIIDLTMNGFDGTLHNGASRLASDIPGCLLTTTSTITTTACNRYYAPSGAIFTSDGIYMDTITNATGADSIITINLTMLPTFSSSESATACYGKLHVFPDGSTQFITAVTTHSSVIQSSIGCDSTIVTTVTPTAEISNGTTVNGNTITADFTGAGATYQWKNCANNIPIPGATNPSFTTMNNGDYAVEITVDGCSTTSACRFVSTGINQVMSFNGYSDYIQLGTAIGQSNIQSIEFWFSPAYDIDNTSGGAEGLMFRHSNGNNNNFGVYIGAPAWPDRAGKIVFQRNIGTTVKYVYSDNDSWNGGQWYHVAATIDGSGMKLYIDGVLQQDTDFTSAPVILNNASTYLGKWGALNLRYFNGQLDNIRMWSRGLSQSEIQSNNCAILDTAQETNLEAYWTFDASIDDVTDLTGNNHTGIVSGTTRTAEDIQINTTDIINSCGPITWIDGNVYNTSNNTATYTLSNVNGCDSIVALNLTVNTPTTTIDVQTICGTSYTWIDGNTYMANNNTATVISTNANGCDDIINLDLTLLPTYNASESATICNGDFYVFPDGVNQIINSVTTYSSVLQTTLGCDSIIVTTVTPSMVINTATTVNGNTITADQIGASYQWIDCADNSIITGATDAAFTPTENG